MVTLLRHGLTAAHSPRLTTEEQPTVTTIPVTDVQPGDLLDTANAIPPGPIVRVRQVATYDGRTYVVQRDPGAIVPPTYAFPADALVSLHSVR